MTTRELLQMALNALEVHTFMTRPVHESTEAMAAISEYLAKPEPTPVAWMTKMLDTGPGQYAMWGQKPTSDYWLEHPEKLIPLFTKD